MSNSGHIMGIIQGTSPIPKKYNYRTNSRNYKDPDQWHNFAKKNIGSWWNHWNKCRQGRQSPAGAESQNGGPLADIDKKGEGFEVWLRST